MRLQPNVKEASPPIPPLSTLSDPGHADSCDPTTLALELGERFVAPGELMLRPKAVDPEAVQMVDLDAVAEHT